jgi:hypothetical protein
MDQPPAPPRRSWVAVFVVLAGMAALAVALPLAYNLRQQLRPEQLEEARARWRTEGPADYDLECKVRRGRSEGWEEYRVRVRGGRVVFASCDGEVLFLGRGFAAGGGLALAALSGGEGRRYGIDGAFARIEEVLNREESSARRNFTVAVFDPKDGHPRHFVHRVRGTDEREEWTFLLLPPGGLEEVP